MAFLKAHPNDSEKCFREIQRYIKKNPLSQANSLLRVIAIPVLLAEKKYSTLNDYIKKIRCADISAGGGELLAMALFILREFGLDDEYAFLKSKVEKDQKFSKQPLCLLVMSDEKNTALLASPNTNIQIAIVSYYEGIKLIENEDHDTAKEKLKTSCEAIPLIKRILEKKGYEA